MMMVMIDEQVSCHARDPDFLPLRHVAARVATSNKVCQAQSLHVARHKIQIHQSPNRTFLPHDHAVTARFYRLRPALASASDDTCNFSVGTKLAWMFGHEFRAMIAAGAVAPRLGWRHREV